MVGLDSLDIYAVVLTGRPNSGPPKTETPTPDSSRNRTNRFHRISHVR